MVHTLLTTTQTKTPNEDILGIGWAGEYQLLCTVYDSSAVVLQVRPKGGTRWLDAKYKGDTIELTEAGDAVDVRIVRDFEYRVRTASAGAVVVIAKHDLYG